MQVLFMTVNAWKTKGYIDYHQETAYYIIAKIIREAYGPAIKEHKKRIEK